MRAVAFRRYGGPEVLEVADLPVPEPGPGEVRVRVAAATVNPTDVGMRSGRQAATLDALTPPYVPGMELSGTVDAVGSGAGWKIGDEVVAIVLPTRTGRGAQAEQVIVPAESVARKPSGVSLREAATIPMNGLTARRALDLLALNPKQTLLVTGAAGAVGGYAIQLGKAEGLRVIAISAPRDETLVKGLGADDFVSRDGDIIQDVRALAPDGVDGVVDAAVIGSKLLPAVRDGGKFAVVRAFDGEAERNIGVEQVRVSDYARNQEALNALCQMAADGKLTLRVAETFPPERAGEAQQKLNSGGVRGRLLIAF